MIDRTVPSVFIRRSDNRVEPLEPDRISRALFAATESLGRPDAFLARELTDSIVRLLAEDAGEPLPMPELTEAVTKFVRELGHPALARCYHERSVDIRREAESGEPQRFWELFDPLPPPAEVRRRLAEPALREQALTDVFPRDVVSVVRDGLLVLSGGEHPFELAGAVLGPGLNPTDPTLGVRPAVEQASNHTGGFVVLDGPEYGLASLSGDPPRLTQAFLKEWRGALSAAGLSGIIHLNQATAPAWASDAGTGPLFAGRHSAVDRQRVDAIADAIVEQASPDIQVAWRLSRADLTTAAEARLQRLLQPSQLSNIEFVFDRSRRPISLGPGLSRINPAALLLVGVHLPRLVEQITPRTPERFLYKLVSLARLARSAGHAKLDFLRRHGRPDVKSGFLLDRARLVVVPIGLDEAVRQLVGAPLCDGGPGLACGVQIVQQLLHSLTREPPHNMEAVIDSLPTGFSFVGERPERRDAAGLTPWDPDAPPRDQLRAAGTLHQLARGGAGAIHIAPHASNKLKALIRSATQCDLRRLRVYLA